MLKGGDIDLVVKFLVENKTRYYTPTEVHRNIDLPLLIIEDIFEFLFTKHKDKFENESYSEFFGYRLGVGEGSITTVLNEGGFTQHYLERDTLNNLINELKAQQLELTQLDLTSKLNKNNLKQKIENVSSYLNAIFKLTELIQKTI